MAVVNSINLGQLNHSVSLYRCMEKRAFEVTAATDRSANLPCPLRSISLARLPIFLSTKQRIL